MIATSFQELNINISPLAYIRGRELKTGGIFAAEIWEVGGGGGDYFDFFGEWCGVVLHLNSTVYIILNPSLVTVITGKEIFGECF